MRCLFLSALVLSVFLGPFSLAADSSLDVAHETMADHWALTMSFVELEDLMSMVKVCTLFAKVLYSAPPIIQMQFVSPDGYFSQMEKTIMSKERSIEERDTALKHLYHRILRKIFVEPSGFLVSFSQNVNFQCRLFVHVFNNVPGAYYGNNTMRKTAEFGNIDADKYLQEVLSILANPALPHAERVALLQEKSADFQEKRKNSNCPIRPLFEKAYKAHIYRFGQNATQI
jgi:hypothetical protein